MKYYFPIDAGQGIGAFADAYRTSQADQRAEAEAALRRQLLGVELGRRQREEAEAQQVPGLAGAVMGMPRERIPGTPGIPGRAAVPEVPGTPGQPGIAAYATPALQEALAEPEAPYQPSMGMATAAKAPVSAVVGTPGQAAIPEVPGAPDRLKPLTTEDIAANPAIGPAGAAQLLKSPHGLAALRAKGVVTVDDADKQTRQEDAMRKVLTEHRKVIDLWASGDEANASKAFYALASTAMAQAQYVDADHQDRFLKLNDYFMQWGMRLGKNSKEAEDFSAIMPVFAEFSKKLATASEGPGNALDALDLLADPRIAKSPAGRAEAMRLVDGAPSIIARQVQEKKISKAEGTMTNYVLARVSEALSKGMVIDVSEAMMGAQEAHPQEYADYFRTHAGGRDGGLATFKTITGEAGRSKESEEARRTVNAQGLKNPLLNWKDPKFDQPMWWAEFKKERDRIYSAQALKRETPADRGLKVARTEDVKAQGALRQAQTALAEAKTLTEQGKALAPEKIRELTLQAESMTKVMKGYDANSSMTEAERDSAIGQASRIQRGIMDVIEQAQRKGRDLGVVKTDEQAKARILELRRQGKTREQVAAQLKAEGFPQAFQE